MRFALLCCGMLGGVLPLVAQTPTTQNQPTRITERMVVTASLEPELRDDLPVSIDVIEAEEIEARQATTIAELLATVPGLQVVRSGPPGQSASLFTRGTESDHTLVLWNGIELNDPFFGGFNWAFLSTEGIDRVEVARGPFSALYGSDAVGGVVQIVSDFSAGAQLRLEAGDNGYGRAALTAGTVRGKVSFSLIGHLRRGDGELDNSSYDSEEVVARAAWELKPGMNLGLVTRVNDSQTGIPLSGGVPSPNREIGWRESEVAVPFQAELDRWRLEARLSRVSYDSEFRDPDDAFGFTAGDTESEALRARAVASYRLSDDARLSFGGETERLEVDDRSVFGVNLERESQRTWAAFAQLLYDAGPVRFDLGLRRDDNNVFGSQVSPKLGVAWRLGDDTRLWAAFGEGFRAPSIGELFFPFSGNRELQPETSRNFELGFERARGAWTMGLTAFENRIEDLIDFDFVTFTNVNRGRARTRGLEAQAGYRAGITTVRAHATYLDAEDRDSGLPLLRRAEQSAGLVLALAPGDWTMSLTGRYVGNRPDVDPVTFGRAENGGYTAFDLATKWRRPGAWHPYARLENLADHEYQEALGFPASGRTLIVGLVLGR